MLPELLTLTIDDERIFFFTLTPSSFLLLPGLEKLPTLGGDRIWNLKDLESCKWIVGRGGRRGEIVRLSTTTLIEKTVCQPFATSDLQDLEY